VRAWSSSSSCGSGIAQRETDKLAVENLVPDLGAACAPPAGARLIREPVVLIEILSPTNVSKTLANVRAYTTSPTVAEIVVLRTTSIAAEVLRRQPDGSWTEQPEIVTADGMLGLDSIGFAEPLQPAYRTTGLD
jgi:Uma2 family endonuclease